MDNHQEYVIKLIVKVKYMNIKKKTSLIKKTNKLQQK